MEVDAFLADSVVGAEGKLYAQGIGWNIIHAKSFPVRHSRIGVGLIIHVPYTATNQAHRLEIHVENSDGGIVPLGKSSPDDEASDEKTSRIKGEFNVGRPASLPPGDEQLVSLAINIDGMMFDVPDMYNVVISLDGNVVKRLSMRVQQLAEPRPAVR